MDKTAEVVNQVGQNIPLNAQQGNVWGMVVYCLVIVGILYLFMIRPNKKRMAEYQKKNNGNATDESQFNMLKKLELSEQDHQELVDYCKKKGIKVGNRIMAAGIYGTVKKINEKTIEMEVAKGVVIEVSKNAVAGVE